MILTDFKVKTFKVTRTWIIEDSDVNTENEAIEQVDIGADYLYESCEELE